MSHSLDDQFFFFFLVGLYTEFLDEVVYRRLGSIDFQYFEEIYW